MKTHEERAAELMSRFPILTAQPNWTPELMETRRLIAEAFRGVETEKQAEIDSLLSFLEKLVELFEQLRTLDASMAQAILKMLSVEMAERRKKL